MLEFSADWCVPCHELERSTLSNRRVIAAAASFATFKVDLTHYDAPEVEQYRRRYEIKGVPTLVFIAPDGSGHGVEVSGTRVEGFVSPERILELMRLALGGRPRA